MQISLITLGTTNLERSAEFYTRWFKIEVAKSSNESVKFLNIKGTKLSLFPREELAKDATINADGSGFRGIALAINLDSKEEVDSVFATGLQCGAQSVKKPEMVFWGGYSGYLSDPDGHLWELAWNPFFAKDENGSLIIP
jgi:uncharacterized glyoxalase superfamily protein PhnB